MKKINLLLNIVLLLSLVFAVTACDTDLAAELQEDQAAQGDAPAEVDPAAIFTEAAATVNAQITQTAAAFSPTPPPPTATQVVAPTATLIQLNGTPTTNPALPAGTATQSTTGATPIPTATTAAVINTQEGPICDAMTYGSPLDINYADDTVVPAGTTFEKIWRVVNSGVCTWDDGYVLVYIGDGENTRGDQNPMGVASIPHKIKTNIEPGQSVDLGAVMTAPLDNGTYESCFILQNDRGVYFGGVVCVRIKVTDGR